MSQICSHCQLVTDGLGRHNPVLVALLGLCPLLAVSTTAHGALSLGLGTTGVLIAANGLIASLRTWIIPAIRLPAYVLILASFVTLLQQLLAAYADTSTQTWGLFLPLIVTNCVLLARAESFASRQPILPALYDGLGMGLGFTAVLFILGSGRELLGHGSWFGYHLTGVGIPLALLPPGAFLGLATLLAAYNQWNKLYGNK